MAAQAADNLGAIAQREPSMEEILASIRRIIEDSDTSKPDTVIPEPANNSAAPSHAEPDLYRRDYEPATVRSEPVVEPQPSRFEPAGDIPRAADPFAVRAAEPLVAPPVAQTASEAPRHYAPPPTPAPVTKPVIEQSAPVEAAPIPEEPALPDSYFAEIEALTDAAVVAPDSAQVSTPVAAKSNIISEVAGRQVAAAFGELTEAFAATRRRTFDEVAEDMMRPMLQDWLDNNLPTLVEKLVREEIERIARGGSR
ncbi:MAG: PopZ family protein [Mesorhizobium sp.]